MDKLYFGAPLGSIKNILVSGFQPGDTLRSNLLEAMIDARNQVGLNRRFRPVVLVMEAPPHLKVVQKTDQGIVVVRGFSPVCLELFLIRIDFRSPRLAKVSGTISPASLLDMDSYTTSSDQKRASR